MLKYISIPLLLPIFCNANTEKLISIAVGHQKQLHFEKIKRISLGDPNIADFKLLKSSSDIILYGKKAGSTDLVIWESEQKRIHHTISVHPYRSSLTQKSILKKLSKIPGLKIQTKKNKIFVAGNLYKNKDALTISNLEKTHPELVNLTQFDGRALLLIASKLEKDLLSKAYDTLEVSLQRNTISLSGELNSKQDIFRVSQLAQSYFYHIENNITLGSQNSPMILLDVKFMEVRTSKLDHFGIKLPEQMGVQVQSSIRNGHVQKSLSSLPLEASINMLSEQGNARVLANPKLLCKHNQPAKFLAGGEIPIRLISERTAQIVFKPYGVQLEVTAQIDADKKVNLEINLSVSDLNPAVSVDGVPGIIEHKINTLAQLYLGEQLALGGLYQKRDRKSVRKTPLFGHLPIIGELFKSRAFQKDQSEFIVLIQPLAGKAHQPEPLKLKDRFQQNASNDEAYKFSLLD